ncbi:hypothetical protein BCR33DRAFT_762542 [Rhizoclosmatium globosum]|uniref:RIC1 C-terminal alpha solenoid region domain-containing protein n=1 Tax=Rhizoclosmatium globosum TaxID=329046 RepID=A0A1Y2CVG3_9FUNG|nr:hypothetical protein BCR33DRAFT_762542 [Rhizoclosmatium globosum]|eukprot:ORY51003.1 hypothetical protein BCR33DRAFT_762542 [Rhizoclosmatium globosum]
MLFPDGTAKKLAMRTPTGSNFEPDDWRYDAGDKIVSMQPSFDRQLAVVVTTKSLYLWSMRPLLVLAKCLRSEVTLREDGSNVSIVWKPDSSMFIVLTDKGLLHFYEVLQVGDGMDLSFRQEHHFISGSGEDSGRQSVSVNFKMALEINTGVRCGVGLSDEVLLCTQDSPSILFLAWSGIVNEFDTVALEDLDFLDDSATSPIKNMSVNEEIGLFSWINEAGDAYIARRDQFEGDEDDGNWTGLCVHRGSTSCLASLISFNERFYQVAIGDTSGRVVIYSVSENFKEVTFSHELTVDLGPSKSLNAVNSMDWTQNGRILAVGWKHGGLAIWSVFGKLVFQTKLDVVEDDLNVLNIDNYFFGVRNLFWCDGAFELVILSTSDTEKDIAVLKFLQSPLFHKASMENISSSILVGDECVLIRNPDSDGFDAVNLEWSNWDSIQVPATYLATNWPIQYTAVNSAGKLIAVAGKHGFALYNVSNNRWKLFGIAQEESFSVNGGLLWFEDYIVAAVKECKSSMFQIRIFNCDLRCLHTEAVPEAVHSMSRTGFTILCLMNNSVLSQYSICNLDNDSILFTLNSQKMIRDIVGPLQSVQSLLWIDTPNSKVQQKIIILSMGKLSLLQWIDGSEDKWEHIVFDTKIECFWFSQPNLHGLKTSFCAYGQLTMQFVLMIYHFIHCSQLLLDSILQHYLSQGSQDVAFQFISNFEGYRYFSHSLEMLLHKVIEKEAGSKFVIDGGILPVVVTFLKQFGNFLDIVANCARKSDISLWEHLFHVVGQPQALLQECLDMKYLATATSYLIILQTLDQNSVSVAYAKALLQKSLDLSDWKTAKELLRFYKSLMAFIFSSFIRSENMTKSLVHSFSGTNPGVLLLEVSPASVCQSSDLDLELLLHHHSQKLLAEYKVRALGQFSVLLSRSLGSYLKSERKRRSRDPTNHDFDWSFAFATSHVQFNLAYPDHYGVDQHQTKMPYRRRQSLPLNFKPAPPASVIAMAKKHSPLSLDMSKVTCLPVGPKSAHLDESSIENESNFNEIK